MSNDEAIKKIEKYQPLIKKVSFMYGQNSAEVDDMFQEICIQAWRAYPQFKGDSKFSTWLYRVSINTAISWIRKEKRHRHGDSEDEKLYGIHDDTPFYVEEEKKEQVSALHRAIKKLNDVDRTLVLLYLEEVAYAEISEILGLTVNNIKVKMNRVKKRLKRLIDDDEANMI
ncbi:MAG: RNA polymerase sigma factor [Salinivirgaceae bacterium]|nr:RNA polymerase sigma factor [Salinivirgaceae bacterium]